MGAEAEHDYLDAPEVVVGPCGACGAETSRCEMCTGFVFVCSACARRMIPACACDEETDETDAPETEAELSAGWGDPRPIPEWRD